MRVLVVEDDRPLGAFLQRGMELEGHQVEWVCDGEAALVRVTALQPQLVVLDLSLPKRDGVEVLAAMRARQDDASILVLTGRCGVDTKVKCLNLGADDCLFKPFSFYELTARCRALLRRRDQFADPILRYGTLQLNRMERKVMRGNRTVELTAKEFLLLEYLLLNRGHCVTRGRLLADVWQMSPEAGTNVVDVYINYLRRKLGGDSLDEPIIETIRGAGYRLGGVTADPGRRPPAKASDGELRMPLALRA
jgi:DNA-binding response OmpR family regulator